MSYDIFEKTEDLLDKRLNEISGGDIQTIKEAGYRDVWKPYIENFFKVGHLATRRFEIMKIASGDEFAEGQLEAIDRISHINDDPYTRGWYQSLKDAHDHGDINAFTEKVANIDLDDNIFHEGYLDACEVMLESDHDLFKLAWNGPNHKETIEMNSFELGKYAALSELAEMADEGYTVADVIESIRETVDSEVKVASEEDFDYRLGVETACYDFLKVAGEVYGQYETDGVEDYEIFDVIFDKVASDVEEDFETVSFGMGKEASLDQLIDMAEEGYGLSDAIGVVNETIASPLEKNASEEDVEYRLGVESTCYELLKSASTLSANYDLNDLDDNDLLLEVLEKIAESFTTKGMTPGARQRRIEELKAKKGMKGSSTQDVMRAGRGKSYQEGMARGAKAKQESAARFDKKRAKKKREQAYNNKMTTKIQKKFQGLSGNQKAMLGAGAGALGAAGLGAAAYGAKRMMDKRKEQEKQSSINDAVQMLIDEGLIDVDDLN